MNKEVVLQRLVTNGLIAIVRAETPERAIRIAEACLEGGVSSIEITFTIRRASEAIAQLRSRFKKDEILLGAGTVLDSETARIAILEGADFVVAPSLNAGTMVLCNRYAVPCLPGVGTVNEIVSALELGADIVKIFPSEILGPGFIKAVRGPLPQARMMPSGGVSLDNLAEWVRSGAAALGVGGQLTAKAAEEDYKAVAKTASMFVEALKRARVTSEVNHAS